jgi:hypothetical protein
MQRQCRTHCSAKADLGAYLYIAATEWTLAGGEHSGSV